MTQTNFKYITTISNETVRIYADFICNGDSPEDIEVLENSVEIMYKGKNTGKINKVVMMDMAGHYQDLILETICSDLMDNKNDLSERIFHRMEKENNNA